MIVLAVARHGQAGQQGSLGDAVAEFLFDLEGTLDIALSVLGLVAAQRDDGEIVEDGQCMLSTPQWPRAAAARRSMSQGADEMK